MSNLNLSDYSARALVLRGDTEPHNKTLSAIGGWFHKGLKRGGPGWIFSKERHSLALQKFLQSLKPKKAKGKRKRSSAHKEPRLMRAALVNGEHYQLFDYSDRALVIRVSDEAVPAMKELVANKTLPGYFNKNLRGGAGWVFSKERHGEIVNKFIDDCVTRALTPCGQGAGNPGATEPQPHLEEAGCHCEEANEVVEIAQVEDPEATESDEEWLPPPMPNLARSVSVETVYDTMSADEAEAKEEEQVRVIVPAPTPLRPAPSISHELAELRQSVHRQSEIIRKLTDLVSLHRQVTERILARLNAPTATVTPPPPPPTPDLNPCEQAAAIVRRPPSESVGERARQVLLQVLGAGNEM